MIQVFKTDEDYKKWLDGQRLPSGIVVYVSDDETMYFSTNNIKGELKTYKCEKEEPIIYPPLIYSAKSAGSKLTVNGQSMTLEQGDNMVLEYPTAITSVKATSNTALTAIQIPNTVTSIEDNAFGDCDALTSITLPDSLTSIGVGAFQFCIGLTSINIPSGVTSISMETFNGCSALASVTLPEGLTNIGSSTFMDCTSLTSITIPNSVTMIDFEAFNYCEALTDFNFNGTMEQWGAITLGDNWNLNAAFTVVHCTDGDVSLEEVIQYPPLVYSAKSAGSTITVNGETVTLEQGDNITLDYPNEITTVSATDNTALTAITMPNTMTFINGSAFKNCYYLTNINMPNTITVINPQAFRDCINLTSITIPENVKNIYDFAFMGCTKLSDFNYNGTTSQWASITLGTDWNFNSAFTVVHCTDGDVSLEEPIQPIQHEYVDLGLPSGLKWAKCNIGAKKETDYGDYFMWGSTEPNNNTNCDWENTPFNNGSYSYDSTYFNSVKDTVCPNGILAKEYDAATHIMGDGWRMPTTDDMRELFNNTTNEWTQVNGVNGYKYTSKIDTTKYIFIPAAGNRSRSEMTLVGTTVNVWSSSLNTSNPDKAFSMLLGSDQVNVISYFNRRLGRSVRGVHK